MSPRLLVATLSSVVPAGTVSLPPLPPLPAVVLEPAAAALVVSVPASFDEELPQAAAPTASAAIIVTVARRRMGPPGFVDGGAASPVASTARPAERIFEIRGSVPHVGSSVMTTAPRTPRVVRLVDGAVDEPSDVALLTAVALGDEGACRAFVDRHASSVLGVAVSVCRDRTLAEDVSQRAFERAWRHAASFDPARASARTWLLTITRRLAIDELRRRHASPVAPDDLLGLLSPAAVDTERAGLAEAGRDRVLAALRSLPDEQRRAVVLASLGGRSAREVAEIEDVPLGTAKTRIRLGLRRLRTELADEVDHG